MSRSPVPTPDEERALRHDLLILELQTNPQVRARLGRVPWISRDSTSAPTPQEPAAPESSPR